MSDWGALAQIHSHLLDAPALTSRHVAAFERLVAEAGFEPVDLNMDDWPSHRPESFDTFIPGRQWYGGCDDTLPRVAPDGVCVGCGKRACPACGKENCPDHMLRVVA